MICSSKRFTPFGQIITAAPVELLIQLLCKWPLAVPVLVVVADLDSVAVQVASCSWPASSCCSPFDSVALRLAFLILLTVFELFLFSDVSRALLTLLLSLSLSLPR